MLPTKGEHCVWVLVISTLILPLCLCLALSLHCAAAFMSSSSSPSYPINGLVNPQQDEYHMMHLVCNSHSPPGSPMPRIPSRSSASDSSVSKPKQFPLYEIFNVCIVQRIRLIWLCYMNLKTGLAGCVSLTFSERNYSTRLEFSLIWSQVENTLVMTDNLNLSPRIWSQF